MNAYNFVMFITISGMIFNCASGKRIPSYAGPYSVVSITTGNESDEFKSTGKIWTRLYYTHPRPKQLQYVRGYFHSDARISDSMKLDVRISQRSNNQWKRNAFVIKMDTACSSLMFHAASFVDLVYYPHEKKCPLPKIEIREIRNQSFEPVFPQFPIMPYGHYLFTMAIIQSDEIVGVVVADYKAVPKL